mmetsp:Transcript_42055/g.85848  ORF Transcript_42055/g.85848 Transcript_42055/m.85848 type:complete len:203 (-) Transcript_42055:477-1085(-)
MAVSCSSSSACAPETLVSGSTWKLDDKRFPPKESQFRSSTEWDLAFWDRTEWSSVALNGKYSLCRVHPAQPGRRIGACDPNADSMARAGTLVSSPNHACVHGCFCVCRYRSKFVTIRSVVLWMTLSRRVEKSSSLNRILTRPPREMEPRPLRWMQRNSLPQNLVQNFAIRPQEDRSGPYSDVSRPSMLIWILIPVGNQTVLH